MSKTDHIELAAKIFCYAFAVLLGVAFFKYAFSYTVPFLIAWGTAYAVYPAACRLSKKARISRKLCSALLVGCLILIILVIVALLGNIIAREIGELVEYLRENGEEIEKYIEDAVQHIEPVLGEIDSFYGKSNKISEMVGSALEGVYRSAMDRLGTAVSDLASKIMTLLPDAVLAIVITAVSCFYFAIDIDVVNASIKRVLPERVLAILRKINKRLKNSVGKYMRAYGVLFVLTFIELLIGFLILKIDYAFLAALAVAFIDFLPVFGTAAVLVPWGSFLLITGKYGLGIGMLALLCVTTVVRQAAEPKIVGKSFGIHPLVSLASVYFGYKILGVVGMVIAPFAALVLLSREE